MPAGLFKRIYCACGFLYDILFYMRVCLTEFVVPVGLFKRISCVCGLDYEILLFLRA